MNNSFSSQADNYRTFDSLDSLFLYLATALGAFIYKDQIINLASSIPMALMEKIRHKELFGIQKIYDDNSDLFLIFYKCPNGEIYTSPNISRDRILNILSGERLDGLEMQQSRLINNHIKYIGKTTMVNINGNLSVDGKIILNHADLMDAKQKIANGENSFRVEK